MGRAVMKNSLRHVAPGKMADLEDDLEALAELQSYARITDQSSRNGQFSVVSCPKAGLRRTLKE